MTEVEAYPRSGALDRMRWPQITYMGPMAMYLRAGSQPVEEHGDGMLVRKTL